MWNIRRSRFAPKQEGGPSRGKFHQKNVAVSKIYVLLIKTLINNDGKDQHQGQLEFIWN